MVAESKRSSTARSRGPSRQMNSEIDQPSPLAIERATGSPGWDSDGAVASAPGLAVPKT
jgi:hypothetical protein